MSKKSIWKAKVDGFGEFYVDGDDHLEVSSKLKSFLEKEFKNDPEAKKIKFNIVFLEEFIPARRRV